MPLKLTRRRWESVIIRGPAGERIATVTIEEIRRGDVRISIDSPRQYAVHRHEVDALIQKQRQEAESCPQ